MTSPAGPERGPEQRPAVALEEAREALNAVKEALSELCFAVSPLLPVHGSLGAYQPDEEFQTTLSATGEEWATAAFYFCEADKLVHTRFASGAVPGGGQDG